MSLTRATLTAVILLCVTIVLIETARRSYKVLVKKQYTKDGKSVVVKDGRPTEPLIYGRA